MRNANCDKGKLELILNYVEILTMIFRENLEAHLHINDFYNYLILTFQCPGIQMWL